MQVAENRLEIDDGLTVQFHVHPEHPVGARVVWSHRDFQQARLQAVTLNKLEIVGFRLSGLRRACNRCLHAHAS